MLLLRKRRSAGRRSRRYAAKSWENKGGSEETNESPNEDTGWGEGGGEKEGMRSLINDVKWEIVYKGVFGMWTTALQHPKAKCIDNFL